MVLFLIGILGITALTAYFDSSDTFTFLSEYKPIVSTFRSARSYAISNMDAVDVDRYGLKITSDEVIFFGDSSLGGEPFSYDPGIDFEKWTIFINEGFELQFQDGDWVTDKYPVFIFYEMGSGDMVSYKTVGLGRVIMEKKNVKRIGFRFWDEEDLEKYIYIFQVSGIAEESIDPI